MIFLKKPFVKFSSRGDKTRVFLMLVLFGFAISLFLMPEDSVAAMTFGDGEDAKSLFGLISRFA